MKKNRCRVAFPYCKKTILQSRNTPLQGDVPENNLSEITETFTAKCTKSISLTSVTGKLFHLPPLVVSSHANQYAY